MGQEKQPSSAVSSPSEQLASTSGGDSGCRVLATTAHLLERVVSSADILDRRVASGFPHPAGEDVQSQKPR